MPPSNVRRGFNRLFLVLTLGWALFCTVAYPMYRQLEGQSDAAAQRLKSYTTCGEPGGLDLGETARDCFDLADRNYQSALANYSLMRFWSWDVAFWQLVIPIVAIPPLMLLAVAVIARWIWRGFQPAANSGRDTSSL